MTHPDDAGRRLSEALHAQASRGPMPQASRPPARPGPQPPPRVPGRIPPPAPRPVPQAAAAPQASAGSGRRQIVWALVVTLLVGAILGGGLALVSVLLPGLLPALG